MVRAKHANDNGPVFTFHLYCHMNHDPDQRRQYFQFLLLYFFYPPGRYGKFTPADHERFPFLFPVQQG